MEVMLSKIRENTVFIISDAIKDVEYIPKSLIATKGQPIEEPIKVDIRDGIVTIVVNSGRKKSKPIAESFKRLSTAFKMTTQGGSDGAPHELNFMFSVKLKLKNKKTITVHLGQGSRMGIRNNWWIGSAQDIKPLTITPSSLNNEGFSLKGIIPAKWDGVLSLVNEVLLKDLTQEVNVFKIE